MSGGSESSSDQALRAVLAHRTMLKAYLIGITRDPDLAEDTLSDVAIEISHSWPSYDQSRPFAAWARGVARRVAADNMRARSAGPVLLDSAGLEALGSGLDSLGDEKQLEARKRALDHCLRKLSARHRNLVRMRFVENRGYAEIAVDTGRKPNSLYVTFKRIVDKLQKCVRSKVETA
jgi:RNA polymerase sigma-70 factor (ECF subfamily)